jgi:hypothetical protein
MLPAQVAYRQVVQEPVGAQFTKEAEFAPRNPQSHLQTDHCKFFFALAVERLFENPVDPFQDFALEKDFVLRVPGGGHIPAGDSHFGHVSILVGYWIQGVLNEHACAPIVEVDGRLGKERILDEFFPLSGYLFG